MRPTSAQRLCALGSAVLLGLVVGTVPGSAAAQSRPASSASLTAQVAALNAEIDRVGAELAAGAIAYEAAAQELDRLTQQQFAAGSEHDALRDAATNSRSKLAGLARTAYKGGMPPVMTALLSGDPRAVSDLAYVQKSVNRLGASRGQLVRDLDEQQAGAGRALLESDQLRRQALAQRQALDGQLQQLAAKTDRLSAELTATAGRLAQDRASAARLGSTPGLGATSGGGCQPASPNGDVNGFLSDGGLCPLEAGRGHRLRTDAAQAFNALSRARQAATGAPLCVTDSYRSYPEQVDVFTRKPALAATPGRSQHGWGLAVDLCGGVQGFGSEAQLWMQVNAPQYGWIHPGWARQAGSQPEAWHWEYVGR